GGSGGDSPEPILVDPGHHPVVAPAGDVGPAVIARAVVVQLQQAAAVRALRGRDPTGDDGLSAGCALNGPELAQAPTLFVPGQHLAGLLVDHLCRGYVVEVYLDRVTVGCVGHERDLHPADVEVL